MGEEEDEREEVREKEEGGERRKRWRKRGFKIQDSKLHLIQEKENYLYTYILYKAWYITTCP